MDELISWVIVGAVCFGIVLAVSIIELRQKKKKEQNTQKEPKQEMPEFTEGQVYQMEDGSLAKYVGNGKFLKVKDK